MSNTQVLYFTAPWCQPCKTFGPRLSAVAAEFGIDVVKIDAEEQPDLVTEFRVMSLPTVIVMNLGQDVDVVIGAKNEQQLRQVLAPYKETT
jgi:thioredoxin-like negative regulator of GroEL